MDRLNLKEVTTIDELNLRLWSYVESEYHYRAHSSLSGKTPMQVWEEDSGDIRWVSDHSAFENVFFGEAVRWARNDSTVQWRNVFYEVPPYLRRSKVRFRYSLLCVNRLSLMDGNVEIPLRPVNPVANAHRSRDVSVRPASTDTPKTGLNAPDLILENMIRPKTTEGRNNE